MNMLKCDVESKCLLMIFDDVHFGTSITFLNRQFLSPTTKITLVIALPYYYNSYNAQTNSCKGQCILSYLLYD